MGKGRYYDGWEKKEYKREVRRKKIHGKQKWVRLFLGQSLNSINLWNRTLQVILVRKGRLRSVCERWDCRHTGIKQLDRRKIIKQGYTDKCVTTGSQGKTNPESFLYPFLRCKFSHQADFKCPVLMKKEWRRGCTTPESQSWLAPAPRGMLLLRNRVGGVRLLVSYCRFSVYYL